MFQKKYLTVIKHVLIILLVTVFSGCASVGIVSNKTHDTKTTRIESVAGKGTTKEDAKQDAFRNAVEEAVGSLLLSSQISVKDKVFQDDIKSYSAGYINDYDVIFESEQDGQWTVVIDATIASSKIAHRFIESGEKDLYVAGILIEDVLNSDLEQRYQGDHVLSEVMSSYPTNAYLIEHEDMKFRLSQDRKSFVEIPYKITMNQTWLEALTETLDAVSINSSKCNNLLVKVINGVRKHNKVIDTKHICDDYPDVSVTFKNQGEWFGNSFDYKLIDITQLEEFNQHLDSKRQEIGVYIEFLDANLKVVESQCIPIPTQNFISFMRPNLGTVNLNDRFRYVRPYFHGQGYLEGKLVFGINDMDQLNQLTKVRLTIQDSCY